MTYNKDYCDENCQVSERKQSGLDMIDKETL